MEVYSAQGGQPLKQELKAAEFFAGIGLVRLALEHEGWKVVFANDIDVDKFSMYRANYGTADFILGDIHKLSADLLPDCQLFTASFPCNDLSIAGSWSGLSGKQSSLLLCQQHAKLQGE